MHKWVGNKKKAKGIKYTRQINAYQCIEHPNFLPDNMTRIVSGRQSHDLLQTDPKLQRRSPGQPTAPFFVSWALYIYGYVIILATINSKKVTLVFHFFFLNFF